MSDAVEIRADNRRLAVLPLVLVLAGASGLVTAALYIGQISNTVATHEHRLTVLETINDQRWSALNATLTAISSDVAALKATVEGVKTTADRIQTLQDRRLPPNVMPGRDR